MMDWSPKYHRYARDGEGAFSNNDFQINCVVLAEYAQDHECTVISTHSAVSRSSEDNYKITTKILLQHA